MKKVFKIRHKISKELLPEDHHLYLGAHISVYGSLLIIREDSDENGYLVNWIDAEGENYEAVFE